VAAGTGVRVPLPPPCGPAAIRIRLTGHCGRLQDLLSRELDLHTQRKLDQQLAANMAEDMEREQQRRQQQQEQP
jgi:hypothetical protein